MLFRSLFLSTIRQQHHGCFPCFVHRRLDFWSHMSLDMTPFWGRSPSGWWAISFPPGRNESVFRARTLYSPMCRSALHFLWPSRSKHAEAFRILLECWLGPWQFLFVSISWFQTLEALPPSWPVAAWTSPLRASVRQVPFEIDSSRLARKATLPIVRQLFCSQDGNGALFVGVPWKELY